MTEKYKERDKYTKVTIEDHHGNKTAFQMFLVNGKTWAIASMDNVCEPATFCVKKEEQYKVVDLVAKGLKRFIESKITLKLPNKIPPSEYFNNNGEKYVIWELVEKYHTKEECDNFSKFMAGQTSALLSDGKNGIFTWDYERWVNQGKKDAQGKDWD